MVGWSGDRPTYTSTIYLNSVHEFSTAKIKTNNGTERKHSSQLPFNGHQLIVGPDGFFFIRTLLFEMRRMRSRTIELVAIYTTLEFDVHPKYSDFHYKQISVEVPFVCHAVVFVQ